MTWAWIKACPLKTSGKSKGGESAQFILLKKKTCQWLRKNIRILLFLERLWSTCRGSCTVSMWATCNKKNGVTVFSNSQWCCSCKKDVFDLIPCGGRQLRKNIKAMTGPTDFCKQWIALILTGARSSLLVQITNPCQGEIGRNVHPL